jgi:hypothetical protein
VSREELIKGLNDDLAAEWGTVIRCTYQAGMPSVSPAPSSARFSGGKSKTSSTCLLPHRCRDRPRR